MSKMPPIPPEQLSDKGPGGSGTVHGASDGKPSRAPGNLAEQDRQGDIKQNTTHQGYQQDR
jgi:hypothetical protein